MIKLMTGRMIGDCIGREGFQRHKFLPVQHDAAHFDFSLYQSVGSQGIKGDLASPITL